MKPVKRILTFVLCLCLLGSMVSAFAAEIELPGAESIDALSRRISELLDELDLREKLEDLDTDALLADIKALAQESASMDDETLNEAIRALTEKHGLSLNDEQIAKLVKLCRSAEKGTELKDKAENAKEKATGFWQRFREFAHRAAAFFTKLSAFLQKV